MNPVGHLAPIGVLVGGAIPNTGPSLENAIFDPTLYALTAVVVVVAALTTLLCISARNTFADQRQKSRVLGTGVCALGYAVVIIAAIVLLTLMRADVVNGFVYLQAEFGVAYVACAMILYGVDKAVFPMKELANQLSDARREFGVRAAIWASFLVTLGIALAFLLNTSTYTVSSTGSVQHVAQQGIFWLPAFFVVAVGAVSVPASAVRHSQGAIRRQAIYLALFFLLVPIGMSKESNLIPSLGDPLLDMLVAFVPFTAASSCLLVGAAGLSKTPDSSSGLIP
jgi:hypothetical protein